MRLLLILPVCVAFWAGETSSVRAARTVLYPGPPGMRPSQLYQVSVNNSPLFVYPVTINPTGLYRDVAAPAAMVYFDFEGQVTVEITAASKVSSARVHPLRRGVKADVQGRTVRFVLTAPGNYVVLFNDSCDEPLFVFANPLEASRPLPGTPGVLFFGPGVHSVGVIELQSDQTLYLAGGAFVKGRVRSTKATNVRILGRGILYGGEYRKQDVPPGERFVTLRNCRDLHIEGIILLDAFAWNIFIAGCQSVCVDNVKIISWRMNSDGINPVSSEDVIIRNCFIKNHDDGISVKGKIELGKRLRNITVSNCVMWQNWMRSFVVGGELAVETTENIVFRDSDIIFSGINPNSAGNRDAALGVWNVDACRVRDVVFENIYVEEAERVVRVGLFKNKHSTQPQWGHIEDIIFRNITVARGRAAIELSGHSERHLTRNITFENLRIGGQLIDDPADVASYHADPFTRNVKFVVTR